MDAVGKLKRKINDEAGMATVYLALILVAMIGIAGLAIDLGYMYVSRGQLQNAADSAALAGVQKMKLPLYNPYDLRQRDARNEAVAYASKNVAANQDIAIANDENSNSLNNANDITIGHWNGSGYSPGTTPVNAIQARARRTKNSPVGPVETFLAKVLGIKNMDVSASAIAAIPPKATQYFALYSTACTGCTPDHPCTYGSAGKVITPGSSGDLADDFVWTTFLNSPTSASDNGVRGLICSDSSSPSIDVCGQGIYTTNGTAGSLFQDFASVMYDPALDSANKTFNGNTVSGWWVILPVTSTLPFGSSGTTTVTRYAQVLIKAICPSGNATGCKGPTDSGGACNHYGPNTVVIEQISCVPCSMKDQQPGLKPMLVQ